jgi:hypothetical protein
MRVERAERELRGGLARSTLAETAENLLGVVATPESERGCLHRWVGDSLVGVVLATYWREPTRVWWSSVHEPPIFLY